MVTPMLSFCSSLDRHLGCVHILAVLKDDVIDIFIHKSLCGQVFPFFLSIYLPVELLGHMITLRNYRAFSIAAEPFDSPIHTV